ncbi:MAG: AAA family ATPase [Anaerolineae bacterium]|nr:AAA family ATPase [Anaerolineae bacterium]
MAHVSNNNQLTQDAIGITRLTVSGYKSIREPSEIEVRPLTILAGANSSGKSSMVQPLLMMKQTLEATHDPGSLLLDGPNVRFTKAEQFLCRQSRTSYQDLIIGVEIDERFLLKNTFHFRETREIELIRAVYGHTEIRPEMDEDEIVAQLPPELLETKPRMQEALSQPLEWYVSRNRCLLEFGLRIPDGGQVFSLGPSFQHEHHIGRVIHVPGLRGNPERTYRVTPITGPRFHGTFESYVASVVSQWKASDRSRLTTLGATLRMLGLTWKVSSEPIDDTQVELRVGRLRQAAVGGARDLVSIADVGFGVSQVLPVLVALLVARRGQLVYLEQPELHLHPKAQHGLANILAEAAQRGVRVIVETHSSILLLGIQTLIAQGKLDCNLVKLHWFTQNENGCTTITSRDVDSTGAYGDWPEDFADAELEAQGAYLDAVEMKEEGG